MSMICNTDTPHLITLLFNVIRPKMAQSSSTKRGTASQRSTAVKAHTMATESKAPSTSAMKSLEKHMEHP